MRNWWAYGVAALALGAGCTFGAGGFVGYGDHGIVYGTEGNAGASMRAIGALATVGVQNDARFVYARADVAGTPLQGSVNDTSAWGGRLGIGGGYGNGERGGMFVAGATAAFALGKQGSYPIENASCEYHVHAIEVSLELRYAAGGFQIVAAPRYQFYAGNGCHN